MQYDVGTSYFQCSNMFCVYLLVYLLDHSVLAIVQHTDRRVTSWEHSWMLADGSSRLHDLVQHLRNQVLYILLLCDYVAKPKTKDQTSIKKEL